MNKEYNKLKMTTMMTIAVFALIGTTGITTPAFAGGPTICTEPPSNMVGWWPGDGTTNDFVNGNDGTGQNGATYYAGMVSQGFSLDGSDDFVNVSDDDFLDITDEITIDAWINATTINTYKTIVAKGNATDGDTINYGLQIIDPGTLRFFVNNGVSYAFDDSSSQISSDVLTHVAVTFNATADGDNLEFYINGVSAGSGSITTQDMIPNDDALDIGRHQHQSSGAGQYFAGVIDELEIFDRVLEQTEIQAIYNAGSFGKCGSLIEPSMVNGIFHPGDTIEKKLTIKGVPTTESFDVIVNATNSDNSELCIDALDGDVLTLTNSSGSTDGIATTPTMIFYDEKITAMPGSYHCTVEFIANVTTSSQTFSLATQTAWLDVIGSKGYWKNHPIATEEHLPITLGNNVLVDNNATATKIFEDHKGKFGLDKVAAQLLAAALNVWALMNAESEATECIEDTIAYTNTTLGTLLYDGPGGNPDPKLNKNSPYLSGLKANHTALDDFNNNGCPVLGP